MWVWMSVCVGVGVVYVWVCSICGWVGMYECTGYGYESMSVG